MNLSLSPYDLPSGTLVDVQTEMGTVRYNHEKDKSALTVAMGQMKHLEQMSQEKSEKIAEWVL